MTHTAVERFSRHHDADLLVDEPVYRERLPITSPGPGQQYAFQVDLDACTGCKACVTACHSMNGLDDGESWRRVGLLVGSSSPYQQTITTGCHHCVDPACLSGCPVDAYEKDPITGIVHHLDDQCIGCRYCTLMCPYEVPAYNPRLGIVRKCDLCAPRLAIGEEPACVQGCPTNAISITLVDVATARSGRSWTIPESPSPAHTSPTTVYRSALPVPADALPADHHQVAPAPGHRPLALMLVLSQLAVGSYLAASHRAGVALAVAVAALAASLSHLGRPLQAWRAVIGLRHSWVSREIVAVSAFTGLAALHALLGTPPGWLPPLTGILGVAGVACSIGIYGATGRAWWAAWRLTGRFGASTLTFALAAAAIDGRRGAAALLVAVTVAKLGASAAVLRHRAAPRTELGRTAVLLTHQLRGDVLRRAVLALVGGVAAPIVVAITGSIAIAAAALAITVAGEVVERSLLFTASAAPRMPGGRA